MKRFYRMVTRHEAAPGCWEVHLDGKPVRTPAGRVLTAPSADLADLLVQEWAAQGEHIVPDHMPVNQIVITALDRVADHRAAVAAEMLGYLDTDLLCYRTAFPAEVGDKQARAWDPWLDWFREASGVRLATTTGLAALAQDPAAHRAVRTRVEGMNDLAFTVAQLVTALSGSLVLALAFMDGAADADDVLAVAHVEEDHKAEIYNEALHGLAPHEEKRRMSLHRDLAAAQAVRECLKTSP